MIDILMQLADIGTTVTVVVVKKDLNYLISVTPKTPTNNLQPVVISGTKEDILADIPNILKGMGEMKRNITNLESINKSLEKKVEDKVNPPVTEKPAAAKTGGTKKGPIKIGSGTTETTKKEEPKTVDLFAAAEPAKPIPDPTDEDELVENNETEDLNETQDEAEIVQEQPVTVTADTPITQIPETQTEEEEEIF